MSIRTRLTVGALASALAPVLAAAQPSPSQAARAWHERNQSAIIAELRDLVAIPNVASDSANIRRNAVHLVAMLERRGVRARLLEVAGSPPAVFGELRVPGATRTMVLYAHYDGQPVDPARWTTAPWQPVLRDAALPAGREISLPPAGARVPAEARLYARSASDDKGPIVAMLAALDALRSANIQPSVNIKFFLEGEEEAGSPRLREFLTRHADLLRADAWIFADGPVHQTGRPQVVFGVRGVMGLEMTVYGPTRALHSGHYGNWAPNPALKLAHLLASMRDEEGRILIANFHDDVRAVSAAERRAIDALPRVDSLLLRELGLARSEGSPESLADLLMRPALNVRGIRAGGVAEGAVNAIPTEARASIDFRLVAGQRPEQVRALVEAHVRSRGWFVTNDTVTSAERLRHPRLVRLQWSDGYAATRTPLDHPFARAVVRSVSEATAEPPLQVPTLGGSLPTNVFEDVLGVPLVILPTVNPDNNQHAADENLRLANLWEGIEIFASVIARVGTHWRDQQPVP